MELLESRIKNEGLEELIDNCTQLANDCYSVSNSLNSAPVTLACLSKETQAIANALHRLYELSRTFTIDIEDVRASNNEYIYAVSREIHQLKAALKRIKGPDRDSGIDLGEPHLVIVWNEPALKESLNRLRTHQASLHTLLNTLERPEDKPEDEFVKSCRVIEPDAGIDEALRRLGRHFIKPDRHASVLPRVSDSSEIQMLLDTLVPPPGVTYQQTREMAQQLHRRINSNDAKTVFRILLERADPNISLSGSMLSPLHRAFDQGNMLIAAFLAVAGADVDEPTNDGDTALIRGIKRGFSDSFATLLLHLGARINAVDNKGRSALHHSAASRVLDDETLDVLIATGADLNLTDYSGRTPLHVAILSGRSNAAIKLIKAGANLERQLQDGKTALHLAISMRSQELTQVLVSRGANTDRVLREHTPLTMAINSRCTAITAVLIDGGANLNLASRNGNTPLLSAAATGHDETVRYLLATGADVSASRCQSGYTAMHMAAHKNKDHILRLLADAGAAVDPVDNAGETPLVVATKLGNTESVLRLIELGADVDKAGSDGVSVLSHAVKCGEIALLDALLEQGAGLASIEGAQTHTQTLSGYLRPEPQTSPIHLAAQHGRNSIVLRLVSSGARVESTVYPGRTPLFVAASHGHLSTVQLLLRLGADATARTTHGDTVLFVASGNQATLKYLLRQGIDVNHVNEHSATALHYAALRGHVAAVRLLLEKGAKQRHANAVWENWEERNGGGEYRQGTPAGIARQRGFDKIADMIDRWKY